MTSGRTAAWVLVVLPLAMGGACFRGSGTTNESFSLIESSVALVPDPSSAAYVGSVLVVNRSARPMTVDNVRTDCGCTVADWSDAPTPGGDTLTLPVALKCRGRGEQAHTLQIWLAGVRKPLIATVVGACE